MKRFLKTALATAVLAASGAAFADISIGVVLPLTGPASGLGIPMSNGVKMWPQTIGGEKVKVTILDDGTDPTKGVQAARRLVSEDKVDVIVGSGVTPVASRDGRSGRWRARPPQLALSPHRPAPRQGCLELPHAAEQWRDGQRDGRPTWSEGTA